MNSSKLSIRTALAVIGTLFGALALPAVTQAGSVRVNTAQVCSDTPNLSMSPAGDLVITCTPVTIGPITAPPVCSLPNQTVTAGPSVMATMSASCTNTPTSYTWTGTAPGFANSGTGSVTVGPLTATGSYSFTVVASNSLGAGNTAAGTLTVSAVTIQPPGTCPTPAAANIVANFVGLTWVELTIDRATSTGAAGAVAVTLPQNNPGVITELRSIQSTNTSTTLTDEIAISTCPGSFDVAPECKTWGTVFGSATYLRAWTNPPTDGICSMTPGMQYYANVRNTQFDKVTPACTVATCNMKLQYNAY